MIYILYQDSGEIFRSSDGKVVAPCQSTLDPDFLDYIQWANGNQPIIVDQYYGLIG